MYETVPSDVMSEIVAGADNDGKTKAEDAVEFLDQWSNLFAEIIAYIMDLFEKIKEFLNKGE